MSKLRPSSTAESSTQASPRLGVNRVKASAEKKKGGIIDCPTDEDREINRESNVRGKWMRKK